MPEIPNTDLSFVDHLQASLQNLCGPPFSRLAILQDLTVQLMTDPFASHLRTAQASSHTSLTKTVTRSLEALHRRPDVLKTHRIVRFQKDLDRRRPVIIALDDTLVPKRGKTIYAVKKCFDHVEERYVRAQALVDAVVKQGETVLGVSYRLVEPVALAPRSSTPARGRGNREPHTKDLDLETKQALAREILAELVEELVRAGHPRTKIWVEMDAWYPSERLLRAIRQLGVKFMLAIKKNSRAVLPDKARMWRQKHQKRGRPITILTREIRIDQFFETYRTARYFTDQATGAQITYKEAVLNMKRFGRSKIFAFQLKGEATWRYLLTPVRMTGARRVWERYRHRWTVETMHCDLKQYFGLQKCKCRREEAVKGHFELVYVIYSIYRTVRALGENMGQGRLTAREAYDQVLTRLRTPPPPPWLEFPPPGKVTAFA